MALVIVAVPPEGALPVCDQCRRYMVEDGRGGWVHEDDRTPRCPVGLAMAMRMLTAILSGRVVWLAAIVVAAAVGCATDPTMGERIAVVCEWTAETTSQTSDECLASFAGMSPAEREFFVEIYEAAMERGDPLPALPGHWEGTDW